MRETCAPRPPLQAWTSRCNQKNRPRPNHLLS
nr:MAG TPA_asm: hypothetical protein [Caudoviricetes sp.]